MADNITLDTDEIGIWLINETPEGPQQMGLVTWSEIDKRVSQKNQQVEYLESLGVLTISSEFEKSSGE